MAKIKNITLDDLDYLIEQKILEFIEDPDFGLQLKEEFRKKLKKRLKSPSSMISHQEVMLSRNYVIVHHSYPNPSHKRRGIG